MEVVISTVFPVGIPWAQGLLYGSLWTLENGNIPMRIAYFMRTKKFLVVLNTKSQSVTCWAFFSDYCLHFFIIYRRIFFLSNMIVIISS